MSSGKNKAGDITQNLANAKNEITENRPPRKPKGHRQRGAGTVITGKAAVVTDDGVVLQPHQRLPSQIIQEYCQKEKRPTPIYNKCPPDSDDPTLVKFRLLLKDKKNTKDDLEFCPVQNFETEKVAKDFAALLALFHFQPTLPHERKLPEPYRTTWIDMIASSNPPT
eukprot:gene50408-67510_t